MNYLIQINGDVKGPFPLEKLIEEGVTKRTRVCIDGAEEWDFAENIRELDLIWEPKQISAVTKVNEYEQIVEDLFKPTEVIQKVENLVKTDEESTEIKNDVSKKISGLAQKRILTWGILSLALVFICFWIYNTFGNKVPESSLSEENKSETDTIKSFEKDKPLVKLINPQKEYDKLIDEGYKYYKIDSLQIAVEKFSNAQIVRRDNRLPISGKAKSIYKETIRNGNTSFDNGQIKALIPLALINFKIAQAIDPTPEVEAKIKQCKSNL